MFEARRYIPESIRRQLRQEAYFGCVVCGEPVLDYHHIVPWSEKKHNDPEHMVAVCPTHHRIIGKMQRSKQYEKKRLPFNLYTGQIRGLLATDKDQPIFMMGSNKFINTPNVFSYFGTPLIKYTISEGQNLLNVFLPNEDFWPELKIVDNDILVWGEDIWDLEFRTNYLKLIRRDKKSFVEIDLRGEYASFNCNLCIGGQEFIFDRKDSDIPNQMVIRDNTFHDCLGGIAYGNIRQRLVLPNYAMARPQARIETI